MTSLSRVRCSVILLSVLAAGWSGPAAFAQSLERPAKANLDLPVSSAAVAEDDEDSPEVVELYGATFESDGFVFVGGPTT